MHLNNIEMEFGIRPGWTEKEDSLVVGDRAVDIYVLQVVLDGLEGWEFGMWGVGSFGYDFMNENIDYEHITE